MHHRSKETSTAEDSIMEVSEEEAIHVVDIGAGTGSAISLFNKEKEEEVLLILNDEMIPLQRQELQQPTIASNSTTPPFITKDYTAANRSSTSDTTTVTTASSSSNTKHLETQTELYNSTTNTALHNSTGRYIARRSPDIFLQPLDKDSISLMAIIHCERRVQDSICLPSNPMENQLTKTNSNRSTINIRSYRKVPSSGYRRAYAYAIRKVPVKILHNSRKYQETSNPRLPEAESIHPVRTLQNGRRSGAKRVGRKRCKIDLKDAYTVVPIHPESRRFLTFKNEGKVYQYRSLAFGLNVAPRLFSKLMMYAIEPLRLQGIRMVYYLDDICLLSNSKEDLMKITQKASNHLNALSFIINEEKSILIPSQTQEFLGFRFNTKKMKITVPTHKINNLLQKIKQAALPTVRSCRWIASLLGRVTSMIPAIGEVLLHIYHLQRDLAKSLYLNNKN